MTESFAEVNGVQLRYRLDGAGPLALFGHGLLGSIDQIEDMAPGLLQRLRADVRLLVYDARGHGRSSGPADSAQYTWESLGVDMCALVAHAGEQSAILGGASMGAASALWAAVERPDTVRALVLMIPPPLGHAAMRGPDEQQALAVLDMLAAAIENFGLEKTVELARSLPGFAESPEEADMRSRWLLEQNPLALTHAIRGLVRAPIHDPERYREIRAPMLVLAQEGDGLHPLRAARLLAEKVPHAKLSVAPSPGWWWAHPDDLIAELRAFMTAVG